MAFPATRHSLFAALTAPSGAGYHAALEQVAAAYWRPVYTYLRLRFRRSPQDAEDLTQEFFARALDKGWLTSYEPTRGRFRTYLRTCLDAFAANQQQAMRRQKRGSGLTLLSLDFPDAEGQLRALAVPAPDADVEELFHREWTRSLFTEATRDLATWCQERGTPAVWEVFRHYDLAQGQAAAARLSYADVARNLELSVAQVTNYLHLARRQLRHLVLERLRASCASEAEVTAEAKGLFG